MSVRIFIAVLLLIITASCKKYEEFTNDFDYTTAYFAYQNPVRTVFSNNLKIEVGVMMGGRRINNTDETVDYQIAPDLLTNKAIVGTKAFKMLPADYYSLSNPSSITISAGDVLGKITLTLNEDKFLSDPLARTNTYALPLLITDTSLDSVLVGGEGIPRKDYTIIVIKYVNELSGTYYHRGGREKYSTDGSFIDFERYVKGSEEPYVTNRVWNLTTDQATVLATDGLGEFLTAAGKTYRLNLTISQDYSVGVSDHTASLIKNVLDLGGSRYDKEKKAFYLNYQFVDGDSFRYVMKDTLFFRDDGLKLELW